jgi:hypothetical protein
VPLGEFFLGVSQDGAAGRGDPRGVNCLSCPPTRAHRRSYKVSKRRELDISTVSGGFCVELDPAGCVSEIRLAYGGMAATPARARHLEAALIGAAVDACPGRGGARLHSPRTSSRSTTLRGSAWYRGTVAENLVRGFVLESSSAAAEARPNLSQRPSCTVHLEVVQWWLRCITHPITRAPAVMSLGRRATSTTCRAHRVCWWVSRSARRSRAGDLSPSTRDVRRRRDARRARGADRRRHPRHNDIGADRAR